VKCYNGILFIRLQTLSFTYILLSKKCQQAFLAMITSSILINTNKHIVLLDAISQYNHTRITHLQSIRTLASTSELESSQAHLHKPPRLKGAQRLAQGWLRLLFITPRINRSVTPSLGKKRGDRTLPGSDQTLAPETEFGHEIVPHVHRIQR
jgi:hypothetical protein